MRINRYLIYVIAAVFFGRIGCWMQTSNGCHVNGRKDIHQEGG
jgi:hypothetical protein